MEIVEVRLLGPLLVRRANGEVVRGEEWRSSKTLDLLRLLALNGGRPMSVASIVEALWPAVDWDHGRASLRTAASQLRKVLDTDCLVRQAGCLSLADIWVDSWAYTRLVHEVDLARRAGDSERVVKLVRESEALYAGDVEVTAGDWDGDSHDWFRAQRLRMLLDGADAAASRGWVRDSLDFAERARAVELTEDVARALMRCHVSLGDTDRALDVYELLRRDLVERLGIDPAPQTKALLMLVLSGSAAPAHRWRAVGVDRAVADLVAGARAVLDAPAVGSVVWLCGPEGSGRRTVAELAAAQLGLPLYDLSHLPFDAFAPDVLDSGAGAPEPGIVLLPSRSLPPSWAVSIVHALAERYAGVVVVRAAEPPQDVAGGGADRLVQMGRLTRQDFEALAAMLLQGAPSAELVDRLREESDGLAGAACRIARDWVTRGMVVLGADGLRLASPLADDADTRGGTVAAALRSLDGDALDVLSVLAVSSASLGVDTVNLVLAALGRVAVTRDVLEGLVDAGFAEGTSGGYRLGGGLVSGALDSWLRPSAAAVIKEELRRLAREDVGLQAHLLAAEGQIALALAVTRDHLRSARRRGDLDGVREMVALIRELRRDHVAAVTERVAPVVAAVEPGRAPVATARPLVPVVAQRRRIG